MLDLLVGLWLSANEGRSLGLLHPPVELVHLLATAEQLLPVRGLEPELQLVLGVTQTHIVEVVDGERELSVVHQSQWDKPLDAMNSGLLGGEEAVLDHAFGCP